MGRFGPFSSRVHRGYTLPEVLFTVLIIAVLSAAAIPLYNSSRADAEEKVCLGNVVAIANAETKYRFEKGSYTNQGADLLGHGLAEIPKCPKTGQAYKLTVSGGKVTIACDGTGKHTANTKTLE